SAENGEEVRRGTAEVELGVERRAQRDEQVAPGLVVEVDASALVRRGVGAANGTMVVRVLTAREEAHAAHAAAGVQTVDRDQVARRQRGVRVEPLAGPDVRL